MDVGCILYMTGVLSVCGVFVVGVSSHTYGWVVGEVEINEEAKEASQSGNGGIVLVLLLHTVVLWKRASCWPYIYVAWTVSAIYSCLN